MSTVVTCPSCAQKVKAAPELAGRQVKCPKCGKAFQVPGERKVELLPPLPPAPPPPPTVPSTPPPMASPFSQMPFAVVPSAPVLINTAPQLEPRLGSVGWFGRSFGTTMGVILAILAIPAALSLLVCGGCLMIAGGTGSVMHGALATQAQYDAARQAAAEELARHGVTQLSPGATVALSDYTANVVGLAVRDNEVVNAQVWFDPKVFRDEDEFKVTKVVINHEDVTRR